MFAVLAINGSHANIAMLRRGHPEAFKNGRVRKAYTLDSAALALGIGRRMVAYYEEDKKPILRVVALATRALDMM
jgi:hypothetical protein